MSDRHDLRRQTREIREALSRFEPEQLVDILTHIFRQYVMDGAAAPASSVTLQDELQGLSFAQLIERLQLRLDLPELRLLEVAGGRVSCRVEGRLVPLVVPDARAPEPLPAMRGNNIQQIQLTVQPMPAAAPPPAAPGTETRETAVPGVAPVGHSGSARPDGTARQAPPRAAAATARSAAPAPPPAAGSMRPAGPAAGGSSSAAPAPAPARPEKPAPPEKPDSGGRFNLLEID